MMTLKELLDESNNTVPDITYTGIALDSRKIQKGDVFFALPGEKYSVVANVTDADKKGASVIVIDESSHFSLKTKLPVIKIKGLKERLGTIADRFYQRPSQSLSVIGVTGTNGKSSICHFMAIILKETGHKVGIIGTLGKGNVEHIETTTHTTPDVFTLHQMFSKLKSEGVTHVVMEVSSHALTQHRVDAISFDVCVFTNLSQDHLDYHNTLEEYGAAKQKLFRMPNLKTALINIDDDYGKEVFNNLPKEVTGLSVSLRDKTASVFVKEISQQQSGIKANIVAPFGSLTFKTNLIGHFNLMNVVQAISALGACGVSLEKSAPIIEQLKAPIGRMQLFTLPTGARAIVDFAHTPDALSTVLGTLRGVCKGELICVFGCGGDRDGAKRPQMGNIATTLSDKVILTNDNPRYEKPISIINEIKQGIIDNEKVSVVLDRKEAIVRALRDSDMGDIILIAGKGHEATQEINGRHYDFNDADIIKAYL